MIINWFKKNKRDLPWRGEKNAYHILLSEIIMQQTRIEQGTPYFLRICNSFPTIKHLAQSSEELLLRHWQGLGYYSRARNLHFTAKQIVNQYNGKIPETFSELKKLKGIGDYTAAAIASIAFDEPVPVIDGNVIRVISRLFAIDIPINNNDGKKAVQKSLSEIFSVEQPGVFNEAIMDFGAMQCVPANPNCEICPLKIHCKAFQLSKVGDFPIKVPPMEVKIRHLNYLVLKIGKDPHIIMKQRCAQDIWKNLFEFPLIETENTIVDKQLVDANFWMQLSVFQNDVKILFENIVHRQHKLTHRLLKVSFTIARVEDINDVALPTGFLLMTLNEADSKPKPILIQKFINSTIR